TVVDTRMILKNALLYGANKLVVAHNHPSGNPTPSQADREVTRRLAKAAELMDMQLVDHLIIADGRYISLGDEGIL
ncbi:MAG: JAB domain-containing protein, partial [Chitinophagaceae bacterium]